MSPSTGYFREWICETNPVTNSRKANGQSDWSWIVNRGYQVTKHLCPSHVLSNPHLSEANRAKIRTLACCRSWREIAGSYSRICPCRHRWKRRDGPRSTWNNIPYCWDYISLYIFVCGICRWNGSKQNESTVVFSIVCSSTECCARQCGGEDFFACVLISHSLSILT